MSEQQPQAPTSFTESANAAAQISFDDAGDFARASQGLVAIIDDGRVTLGDHVV